MEIQTADNGWKHLQGTGDESVSVTFIVSGFAYDNKSAKIVTEDTADSDAGLDQGDRAGSGSKSSPQFWL